MAGTQYTHVSIVADDLDASVAFYEDVFEMEPIPTPDWDMDIQWLGCGDLQLHVAAADADPPAFNHMALHVDDLERVYTAVRERDDATIEVLDQFADREEPGDAPPVYTLPGGSVQLYVRDPAGNLVEVNHPDVSELDESVLTNVFERTDLTPPGPGEDPIDVYRPHGLDVS